MRRKIDEPMYRLALLELFAENTEEAFVLVDHQGYVVFMNPTVSRMLGWTPEDLRRRKFHDVVHNLNADGTPYECAFKKVLETKAPVNRTEETWYCRDGKPIRVVTTHAPLKRYDKIVGVLTTVRDNEPTFVIKQALRESEHRFEDIANSAPAFLWVTDQTGICIFVNQFWTKFVGAPKDGQAKVKWLDFVHTEDRARLELLYTSLAQPGSHEFRLRRADGEYRWVLVTVAPRLVDGEFFGFLTIGVDITERRNYEQAIYESEIALRRSNQDLEQFAYSASHDLQEPLRMVSNFMQLVKQAYGDRLDAEGLEWMSYAVEGANRMSELINGLLQYSRAGCGKQEPVNLQAVVEEVISDLQLLVEDSEALLHVGSLPVVTGDSSQLANVFRNLISNAIKYHHPDRLPVISIDVESEPGEYVFTVSDNGIGIAPEHQSLIFQLFKRLHPVAEYPGTGIGLTITQRIVERHGGHIWVDSVLGRGSSFHFTLPC